MWPLTGSGHSWMPRPISSIPAGCVSMLAPTTGLRRKRTNECSGSAALPADFADWPGHLRLACIQVRSWAVVWAFGDDSTRRDTTGKGNAETPTVQGWAA